MKIAQKLTECLFKCVADVLKVSFHSVMDKIKL